MWMKLLVALQIAVPAMSLATTVTIQTSLGGIDVELFDTSTPLTVANFLNYVNSGAYGSSIIHRSVPGFIIQGGGFKTTTAAIPANAPVANEFKASNLRGTIAMAKLGGDPNSATNQWFINLADNSANLDAQNGGFTVFGQVIGKGMQVADAIAALQLVKADAFAALPVLSLPSDNVIRPENLVQITSAGVNTINPAALSFVTGWNLVGNGSTALDVTTILNNPDQVSTAWKWNASTSRWAFYAPSLLGQSLVDYAGSKGYDVLTNVNAGEGFWVNAKAAFATQLPAGAPVASSSFRTMPSGWNLIAIGDNNTPARFNIALSETPPSAGSVPANLNTLWAWDTAQSRWYFYAPSLDSAGTLSTYNASRTYLNFEARVLGPTRGFWVNKP